MCPPQSSSMFMMVVALGPATECHILSSAWPMESSWQVGQSHTIHPSNWWSPWRSSNHNQPHWSAPFLCVSWPLIWLRKSPMAVCPSTTAVFIFCVWIRHPSVEVKWIEWIFWERESGVIQTSGDVSVFWFRPVCFWDHLTFIRLPKVSTMFLPIEIHVIESRIIENLCLSCTWPSAGALGMGEAITWLHTNSCEWGLLVWAVWSRLQLSTCELIHVLLMGQSGPCSSTAVTVWVCMCFFISLWSVAITLPVVCLCTCV